MNYYNEKDPKAAAWLRQLIAQGLIPYGVVDERSIEDVEPQEVAKYTQCHWFAGIAGWSLALQLAGWSTDRPIWTGSCPCQPYSAAGKGDGFADERHLWPAWFWLIEQCRPTVLVGEQVASAAAGPWFDLVLSDLEGLGYACGAYAGPAAGVGAPHIRDRGYWMAYADGGHSSAEREQRGWQHGQQPQDCGDVRLADTHSIAGRQGRAINGGRNSGSDAESRAGSSGGVLLGGRQSDAAHSHWSTADWVGCRDGKWRPVEPSTFPLAHGLPARVGRLRGYGNAIVPQQAAQFVKALMEYAP